MPNPTRRRGRASSASPRRSRTLSLLLLLPLIALSACRSNSPQVVGATAFNVLTTRNGELFQVTLPLNKEETGAWKIESYDSQRLEIVSPPQLTTEGGQKYLRATFRAAAPGETRILFGRVGSGLGARLKSYTIKIKE